MTKKPKTKTKPHKTTAAEEEAEDQLDEGEWVDDEEAEAMTKAKTTVPDDDVEITPLDVPDPTQDPVGRLSALITLATNQHNNNAPLNQEIVNEMQAILALITPTGP